MSNTSVFTNDFNTVFQDEWLWFLLGENVLNDQETPVGVLKIIFASLQTVVKTY